MLSVAGSIARGGSEFGNILYIGEVVGILLLYKGFADSDKIIKSREEKMGSQKGSTQFHEETE